MVKDFDRTVAVGTNSQHPCLRGLERHLLSLSVRRSIQDKQQFRSQQDNAAIQAKPTNRLQHQPDLQSVRVLWAVADAPGCQVVTNTALLPCLIHLPASTHVRKDNTTLKSLLTGYVACLKASAWPDSTWLGKPDAPNEGPKAGASVLGQNRG